MKVFTNGVLLRRHVQDEDDVSIYTQVTPVCITHLVRGGFSNMHSGNVDLKSSSCNLSHLRVQSLAHLDATMSHEHTSINVNMH